MVSLSHPTSDEIQAVRYYLGKLGTGNTERLTDAMITEFWRGTQVEVEADAGITYDSGNWLHRSCVILGTCVAVLGMFVGDTFLGKNVMLGDFRVEEQGLNWNVGIFQAGLDYYRTRYEYKMELLCTKKYSFGDTTSDYSDDVYTALQNIGEDVGMT